MPGQMDERVVQTPRLALRAPADRDVPSLVAGCSDADVVRYIPVIPVPYTEADARQWLAGVDERWQRSRERSFAITMADDDLLLGVITIRLWPGGSIGYWLRSEVRGRGLMTETLEALLRWAHDEHGLRDFFLTTHPDNIASQRVAEKAGFVRTGLVEHEAPFADGERQAVRFDTAVS